MLRFILADATKLYNETAVIDIPRAYAQTEFSFWTKALVSKLSQIGVTAKISLPNISLQSNKTIYNKTLEERYVYNLLKLYWYSFQSVSAIAAKIEIDAPQYGFYGWSKTVLLLLNASIDPTSIRVVRRRGDFYTAVNLMINKEYGQPVENLHKSSFRVKYFDDILNEWTFAEIRRVENNGGGNYTLLLNRVGGGPLPEDTQKYLIIWVTDDRGFIVELYTYDHIDYVIREDAIEPFYPGYPKSKLIYVFEVLINGTWLWLNKPLPSPTVTPIPIPPVKQIRVYSTIHGVDDPNLVEVPSQVEEWTRDYSRPTLRFADWRKRFGPGDKLVFIVPFNETGVRRQRVRITWYHDADTAPPEYLIRMAISPPFAYLDNGVYILQLVANPGYSDWIDWSISLHANGYHIEYTLFGYDVYRTGRFYWFPMKLPGGDWNILLGPIRAIAYRENNLVVVPPTESSIYNELYHKEMIIVPYGVPYFLYFGFFEWNRTVLDYRYLTLFGQISGTSADKFSPKRMKYGSIQLRNPSKFITGNYTWYNPSNPRESNVMHRWRRINDAGNFGYWVSQYNNNNGQIIFIDEATYNLLTTKPYKKYSQVWAWSTYDYARRVLTYDLLYWDPNARGYVIRDGTIMNIFFAGFVYEGGSVSRPYNDNDIWNDGGLDYIHAFRRSTGGEVPQIYYRMFLESYSPVIESIET